MNPETSSRPPGDRPEITDLDEDLGTRVCRAFVLTALLLTLVRLLAMFVVPLPLAPDEAQYAGWSHEPGAGYFSKPPMVAWAIAAASAACRSIASGTDGLDALSLSNEGCVRWLQPLAFLFAAMTTAAIGWRCFSRRVAGCWAGVLLVSMPLTVFYSSFATTDAWLMLFWSLSLYCFVEALGLPPGIGNAASASAHPPPRTSAASVHRLGWWFLCGIAVGLGLLTKYSMGLFVIAAFIWLAWRRRLLTPGPWLAAVTALFVFSPNLWWNAHMGFPTLAHHAEISQAAIGLAESLGERLFSIGEFFLSQWFVFGPLVLWSAITALRTRPAPRMDMADDRDREVMRLMAVFAFTPLVIILAQAALSRAFANWALPAAVGLSLLAAGAWSRRAPGAVWRARASVWFGVALTLLFLLGPWILSMTPWGNERRANPWLRLDDWREASRIVRDESIRVHQQTGVRPLVVSRERDMLANLSAYAWPQVPRAWAWNPQGIENNHYTRFQNLATAPERNRRTVLMLMRVPREATADRLEAELRDQLGAHWRASFDHPVVVPDDRLPALAALKPGGKESERFVLIRAGLFDAYRDSGGARIPNPRNVDEGARGALMRRD